MHDCHNHSNFQHDRYNFGHDNTHILVYGYDNAVFYLFNYSTNVANVNTHFNSDEHWFNVADNNCHNNHVADDHGDVEYDAYLDADVNRDHVELTNNEPNIYNTNNLKIKNRENLEISSSRESSRGSTRMPISGTCWVYTAQPTSCSTRFRRVAT